MATSTPTILQAASGVAPLGGNVSLTFSIFPTALSSATWYYATSGSPATAGGTVTEGSGSGWSLQPITYMGSVTSWEMTLSTDLIASLAGDTGTIGLWLSVNDGTHGDSAIVSTGAVTIYDQPVLAITAPTDGSTVAVLPLVLTWTVTDPASVGIGQQTVIVQGEAGILSQLRLDPQVRQVSWHASELPLVSGEEYVIRLATTDGMGMPIADVVTFATEWAAPPAPDLVATAYNDTAIVEVEVSAESGTTTNVWRVIDNERHLLGTVAGTSGTVTDPLPPLGVEVLYDAQSVYDETGTASDFGSVLSVVGGRSWAINASTDPADLLLLYGNPSASRSLDQGGDSYHFADGGTGGGLPVWYGLTDRDESGSLSFDTVGPETTRQLWQLLNEHPVVWLRDPFGNRWRVHAKPSVKHGLGEVWEVSIKWDAMRFEEA